MLQIANMSKMSETSIHALPKNWLFGLVALNFGFMAVVFYYSGHPLGWVHSDLSSNEPFKFIDGLAIAQFIILAFTLDQLVKRFAVNFNEGLKCGTRFSNWEVNPANALGAQIMAAPRTSKC